MAKSKWTITQEDSEAAVWDNTTSAIGQTVGRRTLSKAEVVRTLMRLAADDDDVRAKVVETIKNDGSTP